jgi:hypothetical protein
MSQSLNPPTGTATEIENVAQPVRAVNTHTISSQVLGQVFNPLIRRFNRKLGTICWNRSGATSKSCQILLHHDPIENEFVKTWMRFVYHVELRDLAVELLPDSGARLTQVSAIFAWVPSIEAYPSTEEDISQFPTASSFVSGPAYPGGLVNKTTLPVDFTYGLQRQVKPKPYVGGTPRIAMLLTAFPCTAYVEGKTALMKMDDGLELYTVRMVATFEVIQ